MVHKDGVEVPLVESEVVLSLSVLVKSDLPVVGYNPGVEHLVSYSGDAPLSAASSRLSAGKLTFSEGSTTYRTAPFLGGKVLGDVLSLRHPWRK